MMNMNCFMHILVREKKKSSECFRVTPALSYIIHADYTQVRFWNPYANHYMTACGPELPQKRSW